MEFGGLISHLKLRQLTLTMLVTMANELSVGQDRVSLSWVQIRITFSFIMSRLSSLEYRRIMSVSDCEPGSIVIHCKCGCLYGTY